MCSVPWLRGNAPGAEGGLGPVGGLELVFTLTSPVGMASVDTCL